MEATASDTAIVAVALVAIGAAMLAGTRTTRNVGQHGNDNLAKLRTNRLDAVSRGVIACGIAAAGLTATSALAIKTGVEKCALLDTVHAIANVAAAIGVCTAIIYPTMWLWWGIATAIDDSTTRT